GKCSPLIRYVFADQCIGCTLCAQNCPVGAIPLRPYRRHAVDDAKCTRCDTCRLVCPIGAVVVESGGRVVAYGPMAQTNSTTSPGGPTSASGGTCATLPQFVPLSEGRSGIVATATSQNSGRAL
ncbi:MAG TPA: 4Fe-4S binding protein, partial [Thermogutta sp.]|nr:4Fe-4S binding protein [Thermogutta sp.]